MFWNNNKKYLSELIQSMSFYLKENDILVAKDLLENREYTLCFDTILTQLYEYDVEINEEEYHKILSQYKYLKIEDEELLVKIKELVRGSSNIPKSVKDGIGDIVKSVTEKKS